MHIIGQKATKKRGGPRRFIHFKIKCFCHVLLILLMINVLLPNVNPLCYGQSYLMQCNSPKVLKLARAACVRHACLRAPCVAWPLLTPTFALFLFLCLLLLTHIGESPVYENLFPLIFWRKNILF